MRVVEAKNGIRQAVTAQDEAALMHDGTWGQIVGGGKPISVWCREDSTLLLGTREELEAAFEAAALLPQSQRMNVPKTDDQAAAMIAEQKRLERLLTAPEAEAVVTAAKARPVPVKEPARLAAAEE
jgi:hypothetical protein